MIVYKLFQKAMNFHNNFVQFRTLIDDDLVKDIAEFLFLHNASRIMHYINNLVYFVIAVKKYNHIK